MRCQHIFGRRVIVTLIPCLLYGRRYSKCFSRTNLINPRHKYFKAKSTTKRLFNPGSLSVNGGVCTVEKSVCSNDSQSRTPARLWNCRCLERRREGSSEAGLKMGSAYKFVRKNIQVLCQVQCSWAVSHPSPGQKLEFTTLKGESEGLQTHYEDWVFCGIWNTFSSFPAPPRILTFFSPSPIFLWGNWANERPQRNGLQQHPPVRRFGTHKHSTSKPSSVWILSKPESRTKWFPTALCN